MISGLFTSENMPHACSPGKELAVSPQEPEVVQGGVKYDTRCQEARGILSRFEKTYVFRRGGLYAVWVHSSPRGYSHTGRTGARGGNGRMGWCLLLGRHLYPASRTDV